MPNLICLDVGTVRIGVAAADTQIRIAVPLETIQVDGHEIEVIGAIARRKNTRLIVVGLPRNASGEETAQSKLVRAFALRLKQAGFKIAFEDESLTSVIAENRLKGRKKRYTREEVDMEAATIILQSFLDTHGASIKVTNAEITDNPTPEPAKAADNPKKSTKKPKTAKQPKEKKPLKKKLKLIISLVVGIPLLLGAAGVIGAFIWYNSATRPFTLECPEIEPNPCLREFVVTEGETLPVIADNLEEQSIIRSSRALQIYAKLNNMGSDLKPGTYQLMQNYSLSTILDTLHRGVETADTFRITFIPGHTLRNIRVTFGKLGYSDSQIEKGFKAALESGHPFIKALGTQPTSLEGLIFPETYEFFAGTAVDKVIATTFDHYWEFVKANNLETRYRAEGLSLYEGITLASIVQVEGFVDDMPGVARVFLNRLQIGMKLGSCATVRYGVSIKYPDADEGDAKWIQELDSPFNTYKHTGLTPTPIATVGPNALKAVAHPDNTDYLFFMHDDNDQIWYARTDEEHQNNVANHCGVKCQGI